MFTVIWKYKVVEEHKTDFEKLYGPHGKWVTLFKTFEGYIDTQLIKEIQEPNCYLTIDTWESQDKYRKFLETKQGEFSIIDAEGESLTISETKIGWFNTLK